jgi:hypothetical protein
MTIERYAFNDREATTAAGVPLRIPAGVHLVERRSLVFRVRVGGRELDLTLAEWARLLHAGCVGPLLSRGRRFAGHQQHPSSVRRAPW